MNNQVQDFTETQYKAIPGQISTNESQGIVECFVAGIGNKDSVGDICLPGCFNGSLKRRKPRVVWGHNWNEPIGKVLEIYEVGPNDPRLPAKMKANGIGGLFAKVQFNLKSERGREAFSNVQFFGEEQEWSIGYKTLDAVFDSTKQANMLKEVELYEVSPVLHGANQLTGTISIKSDKPLKDPKGGLTAAGRAHFKRTEGANLKPGVKGPADTPMKMRRKGSFLTRFFTNPSGPMKDEKGRPTRLALSAAAWGEPVPKNAQDAARLAAKGRRLLERYENSKKSDEAFEEVDDKNVQIYSISDASQNPIIGRMGNLAKALSSHFGGEVAVREADSNVVVFDIAKDGKSETMRASYHTPNESDFMFGAAQPVRVETIYLPLDSDGMPSGSPIPSSPNMLNSPQKTGCGCGGACGMKSSPFATWEQFKNDTPGIHMFVKTANMEMYEVANEIADYHGFDVELLEDGFAIANIDWYEEDARKALVSAIEAIELKAFARAARAPLGAARRARRMVKPSSFDGDGDGMRTGPDGRDNIPYRKPNVPSMMPPRREPTEVPERERKPTVIPRTVPRPQPAPTPAPAPVRPKTPARPGTPGAVSGRMGSSRRGSKLKLTDAEIYKQRMAGASLEDMAKKLGVERIDIRRAEQRHMQKMRKSPSAILEQLRALEMDPSSPSGTPQRAMERAVEMLAEQNSMSAEQVRARIRRALANERKKNMTKSAQDARSLAASIHISISENSDVFVKSYCSAVSDEHRAVIIPIENEFIAEFKDAMETVGSYHNVTMEFIDNAVKITNAAELTDDAVEALSNVVHSTLMTVPVEDSEIARVLGLTV
jgi:HK97 family phage prohead protease